MAEAAMLYHMVPVSRWQECKAKGEPYYPPTYEQDGFIHLTGDPALLLGVANHFYTDAVGDWVVLHIAADKLAGEVKFEAAAPVGDKATFDKEAGEVPLFPHLYGTIDFDAVVGEAPMVRGEDGRFLSITPLSA